MGGDYAPQAVVSGAIKASGLIGRDSKIVLFGDKVRIEEILSRENCPPDTFEIVPTTEVIGMGDNPSQAFRQKPDSSIAVGFRYLMEQKIDGFASAGSTGAMTSRRTASRRVSVGTEALCWAEITTVAMRTGFPSSYSTLTWDLPSGSSQGRTPSRRTCSSRLARRTARVMGRGIRSSVSRQA